MPRILLVEDDRDVRPLLEYLIFADGYHVTSTESAGAALALLDARSFDLVIADVHLPDGSGLTVADKAKELGIRTLVVTGYGPNLPPGTLESYRHVPKPTPPRELLDAIRSCLARPPGDDDHKVVPFPRRGA